MEDYFTRNKSKKSAKHHITVHSNTNSKKTDFSVCSRLPLKISRAKVVLIQSSTAQFPYKPYLGTVTSQEHWHFTESYANRYDRKKDHRDETEHRPRHVLWYSSTPTSIRRGISEECFNIPIMPVYPLKTPIRRKHHRRFFLFVL